MAYVTINTKVITDWPSFHQAFQDALGFPDFNGANMDAWIDCLSDLQEDYGLSSVRLAGGELLHLCMTDTTDFNKRLPKIMDSLVECTAFVNSRYVCAGETPKLSLIFLDDVGRKQ